MILRFKKGALVWYLQRDSTYREAKVVSVDVTVDPPSYAVDLGESVRETESHRLQLRQAGEAPPSVPPQRPLAGPAAAPQQASLELEDDDFGDFADAAEAAQPNVSHANAFTASANGFKASGNGLSQHQPHPNGFSHAPVAMTGLNGHAPPMHGAAHVPAAISQENGEEGFAAFAGAEAVPPGPSVAGTQGAGQTFSTQFAPRGQPWPESTKYTAASAAVQLADQPAFHSLHASHQHARGPSAESSASLQSANGPTSSVFDGRFPPGLLNGAKGEREHRVTPASTLSIAQEDLGSDSDDDFGDFEDALPDVAWNPSAKPELLDRNAPIPLSLFGEEDEDDSAPSEPALDLAAPWGGVMLPGQPWASAVAEQEKAAASQSAVTDAAHEPSAAAVPLPHLAFASSAHEPASSLPSVTVPAQLPGLTPNLGPATSLVVESSDSWVTAFTETTQILPGSNGVQAGPAGPAASEDAADAAQPPAAAPLSDGRGLHSLQPPKAEPQEGFDSTPDHLQARAADGPNQATQLGQSGEPAAEGADVAVTHPASSAPVANRAASAQGHGGQGQIKPPPGSIDWSAMDFDFGAPGSPFNAAEPAPQHSILAPGQADRWSSAAVKADAKASDGYAGSSHAVPKQAAEPPSVAQHADEEDDWDFGDYAEALASLPCPAAAGSAPAADLQYPQGPPAAAGPQPMAEPLSAASEAVQPDWDEGSLAHGIASAVPATQKGSGDGSDTAALNAASAEPHDDWGSWDASEAAAGSPAPVAAELGALPSWAAELPAPKLSAELVPGGSGVMSFDQWGRAYSKLEQQVASSGAGKQPAANPAAAKTPAKIAGTTVSLPEPSWEASQATAADVWASLAALDDGQASCRAAASAGNQLAAPGAARQSASMASHDAFTDPFAAFDSGAEVVDSGSSAGPAASSTENDAFSLPMPPMDGTAVSWYAGDDTLKDELPQQAAGPAEAVTHSSVAVSAADSSQRALQADKGSRDHSEQAPSFTAQRSWGDGWADCVADGMALPPDLAAQPSDPVSSWKRQEEDSALEKALGCDRQSALLCLAQAAAGILVTGQQLWAEACSLGNLGTALGCIEVQQYLAALAHVRFVACAVDVALCCGAASAPSVEAELCRALAQCEEAWQQSPSGVASLAEALQELARGDGALAASAKRAQEASQCLSQPQSAGKLDPAGVKCALTGLPHTACPDIPLVELHGRPAWVHQLANPTDGPFCQISLTAGGSGSES